MSRRNKRRASRAPVSIEATPEPAATAIAPETRLVIREPQTEGDLQSLHLLMLLHGQEFSRVPVNPVKVWNKLLLACDTPDERAMLMAIRGDRLVGYLCLEVADYWYSDSRFITDFGYYVLPKYRGEDIGAALLQEAKAIADGRNLPLVVFINNPIRRRGRVERAASLLGYTPAGSVLAFSDEPKPQIQ